MHVRLAVSLAALVLTTFAGCLVEPVGPVPGADTACVPGSKDAAGAKLLNASQDPIVDDKAQQWDFESYNVRTCSLPSIGWNPLNPTGTPHKYIGELDMRGEHDLGAVAVV